MAKGSSVTTVPPLRAALTGEFLGTALLILLGDGVVAGDVLLTKTSDRMMITTAWGLAVALAVYVCGRLSGGHINPAVTLALAARGAFPRARVLPYWGAQLAGAFVGATLVYADYAEAFRAFEQNEHLVRGAMEGSPGPSSTTSPSTANCRPKASPAHPASSRPDRREFEEGRRSRT